jgi:hypothetical protein
VDALGNATVVVEAEGGGGGSTSVNTTGISHLLENCAVPAAQHAVKAALGLYMRAINNKACACSFLPGVLAWCSFLWERLSLRLEADCP